MISSKDFETSFGDILLAIFVAALLFGGATFLLLFQFVGVANAAKWGGTGGLALGLLFGYRMHSITKRIITASVSDTEFFDKFTMSEGESIVVEIPCNHTENYGATGGKILITNAGVRFIPHKKYGNTGSSLNMLYGDIEQVSLKKRSVENGVNTGGLSRRVAIVLKNGTEHCFVVKRQQKLIDFLNEQLAG